jgi:hypothetical protein
MHLHKGLFAPKGLRTATTITKVTMKVRNRVTSLGEFSLIGRLFSLRTFFKTAEVVLIFELLFSTVKIIVILTKKMGWATFWSIFSQTHLVTCNGEKVQLSTVGVTTMPP